MASRKMFPDSVIPTPTSGLTAHGLIVSAADTQHRDEKMDVSFALGVPPEVQKELEARVDKGETISPQELKTKYAVDSAATDALQTWLKKQGFTITQVTPDRHHLRQCSGLAGRGEPWRAHGAGNTGGPDVHGDIDVLMPTGGRRWCGGEYWWAATLPASPQASPLAHAGEVGGGRGAGYRQRAALSGSGNPEGLWRRGAGPERERDRRDCHPDRYGPLDTDL